MKDDREVGIQDREQNSERKESGIRGIERQGGRERARQRERRGGVRGVGEREREKEKERYVERYRKIEDEIERRVCQTTTPVIFVSRSI